MLNAIQWTAGQEYANCVTFNEVSELLAASVAAGNVNSAGNTVLSTLLASAKAKFDAKDYTGAVAVLNQFVVAGQEARELPVRQQLPGRRRRAREARGQGRRADRLGPRPEVAP